MPKLAQLKIKQWIAYTAIAALVIQTIVPGGLFSWPASRALAATQSWDFSSASDYTSSDTSISILDGYAITDMTFNPAGDNLDSFGPTTDVIESSTAGQMLAAVGTAGAVPYSADYGGSWTSGTAPENDVTHNKLTRITAGDNSGRIIAGGSKTGVGGVTQYTTDSGATWAASVTIANTTQVNAIKFIKAGTIFAGTGPGGASSDGDIFRARMETYGCPVLCQHY